MLLVVLLLCVGTAVFVAVRRRDSLSLYLLGMSLSSTVMLAGIIIYIAKMGGVAASEKTFLFLSLTLQRWLQYLPISMTHLGYVVALGRTLFPLFLLQAALEVTMIPAIRRRRRELNLLAMIPTAFFLIYYFPAVFQALVGRHFRLLTVMISVSMGQIVLYIVISAALMLLEYRAITIPFFKRTFRYVVVSVLSTSALYLLYATKDPAQIYNLFIGEYIRLGITSYISPSLSAAGWLILGLCTVCAVLLGSYGMVRYTQIDYRENQEDLILQRKFDAAGPGVSVFVHGIKNQLLSSRVLHKKLARTLEEAPEDTEAIRTYAAQLSQLNEGMMARMEELYQTVKNSALSLRPMPVSQVISSAVERFHGKYPDGVIEIDTEEERLVLADPGPLGEALYNLLTNGYEAALEVGRTPQVRISVSAERMWTVIAVHDNGGGISEKMKGQIYDPFFTSKNTNYNWGMGLYYVRKIVKSHWGNLRMESVEGQGTTFFVLLPLFGAGEE